MPGIKVSRLLGCCDAAAGQLCPRRRFDRPQSQQGVEAEVASRHSFAPEKISILLKVVGLRMARPAQNKGLSPSFRDKP